MSESNMDWETDLEKVVSSENEEEAMNSVELSVEEKASEAEQELPVSLKEEKEGQVNSKTETDADMIPNNFKSLDESEKLVDASGLKEVLLQIEELKQEIVSLENKFDKKIQEDKKSNMLSKTLYAELQEYRKELYDAIVSPILMEFIQLRKHMLTQVSGKRKYQGEESMISVNELEEYVNDVDDILKRYQVEAFQAEERSDFNPTMHKVLKRIETPDPQLHRKIANSLRTGFIYRNRVIEKELVTAYFYRETQEKIDEQ